MSVVSLGPEKSGVFETGDVVQLRSGGEYMTVRKASKTSVTTYWHDEAGNLVIADFAPAMLMIDEDSTSPSSSEGERTPQDSQCAPTAPQA